MHNIQDEVSIINREMFIVYLDRYKQVSSTKVLAKDMSKDKPISKKK